MSDVVPSFKFWVDVEKRWQQQHPLDEGEYWYLFECMVGTVEWDNEQTTKP